MEQGWAGISNIRPGTKFDRICCESLTRKTVVSPSGRNQLRLCTEAHAGENRLHGGAQMSAAWAWSLQHKGQGWSRMVGDGRGQEQISNRIHKIQKGSKKDCNPLIKGLGTWKWKKKHTYTYVVLYTVIQTEWLRGHFEKKIATISVHHILACAQFYIKCKGPVPTCYPGPTDTLARAKPVQTMDIVLSGSPSRLKPTGQLCFMLSTIKPPAVNTDWPHPGVTKWWGPPCLETSVQISSCIFICKFTPQNPDHFVRQS